jgi:HAD superfamily hydrolase (TIGR01509 family)
LERTAEVFTAELMWQPGAQELVDALRREGVTTALVTNSPRVVVDVAMQRLGSHRFDLAVCGDEVTEHKPDPAPYLVAMQRLGRPAAECLAVEDSPSGTEAAVAAGIPVLVVPSEVPVPDGPGRIFAASLLEATVDELRHIHHAFHRADHRAQG